MTTLAKAPLIEVAAQFRWGDGVRDDDGDFGFAFSADEATEFPARVAPLLAEGGFVHESRIAEPYEDVPFALSRQYRGDDPAGPVIQSGLGVASVHQANEGYEWEKYRQAVVNCFEVVNETLGELYPDRIPYIGIELSYADVFALEAGETPERFLSKKIRAQFHPPADFLNAAFLEKDVSAVGFSFSLPVTRPAHAALLVSLDHSPDLLGRPGFLMDTRVRTVDPTGNYTVDSVAAWLEDAHEVQRHAFQTLIQPAFLRSFQ